MLNYTTARLVNANWKELVGKTIATVDTQSANVVLLEFTDRTSVAIAPHQHPSGDWLELLKEE